jgi:hypothetical protein
MCRSVRLVVVGLLADCMAEVTAFEATGARLVSCFLKRLQHAVITEGFASGDSADSRRHSPDRRRTAAREHPTSGGSLVADWPVLGGGRRRRSGFQRRRTDRDSPAGRSLIARGSETRVGRSRRYVTRVGPQSTVPLAGAGGKRYLGVTIELRAAISIFSRTAERDGTFTRC